MADEPKHRQSGCERSVMQQLAEMTWRERDVFYRQMSPKEVDSAINEIFDRHQPPSQERLT